MGADKLFDSFVRHGTLAIFVDLRLQLFAALFFVLFVNNVVVFAVYDFLFHFLVGVVVR
ncbi:hypothetical protein D3C80_1209980 [compost metagenome]